MKYIALLILMVSYTLAELPPTNDDNSALDASTNRIVILLEKMKQDMNELNSKVDTLQTTVADLSLKVRNMEDRNNHDDVADVGTETDSIDQTLQQQITDLSSNVTALTEENKEIQQQVVDLSSKEQTDYDELSADITALNSTIQANYQELRGDIDTVAAKTCGPLNNGYYYTYVQDAYTWVDARTNCQNKGGDLAYHGLDTLKGREALLCGHFTLCDDGYQYGYEYPFIGLSRVNSAAGRRWEYLNGEYSPFDDQLWYDLAEYDASNEDCAGLKDAEFNYPHFLQAYSVPCDQVGKSSICEFQC